MPEGDMVWRTSARLHQALAGRCLTVADLRWPQLATADLVGRKVRDVSCVGKHILTRLDGNLTLHSHLRMDGSWVISPTPGDLPGRGRPRDPRGRPRRSLGQRPGGSPGPGTDHRIRAILANSEWTATGYLLGMLDLVATTAEDVLLGHLGPDILADDFDPTLAAANLAASPEAIGAALLDQTNLAGIGTIWCSESLFWQGLNPWIPAADLTPDQLLALVNRARRLMLANLRGPFTAQGPLVPPQLQRYVHARAGRECRRCGALIRVAEVGPPTRCRPIPHCPRCQPLPGR